MGKIGPFVRSDYEIGPFVGIGPVVGIGLFGGTGLVVSLTYMPRASFLVTWFNVSEYNEHQLKLILILI